MELEQRRIAILVDNVYQEMEVWYPYYRMQEAGAEVVTVGAEAGKIYTSKLGYPVRSDRTYAEASWRDFDGVIIPGGYAPDHIRRHPEAIQFVDDMLRNGRVVAAICHGPWVLCSCPAFKGKGARVTGFFAIKDDLINAGAVYSDAEVITDSNVITSRKPEDLPAFCRAIIHALTRARAAA
ncbi:MAG TPA: type 1 glutamine amidotransferase domain-containing protein [Bryobacteraceae bacterium]|jgi:protease I|nr:type 1 glutamine amidotransferase domain-containing protein [Bryobacteraceae bacterium]